MKILVISPVYALSGVPLAQLRLANSLSEIGHEVDLIYGCKKYRKIEKSKNLNIIFFNKVRVLGMLFSLIKYLILNRPEVIFSAEDHLNAVVVICCIVTFSNAKISVSSRVTPLDTYKNKKIVFTADLLPSVSHIPIPYVMGYDTQPLLTLKEKEIFFNEKKI